MQNLQTIVCIVLLVLSGCGSNTTPYAIYENEVALQKATEATPLPAGFIVESENNKNDRGPSKGFQKFWWVLQTQEKQDDATCRKAALIMVERSMLLRQLRGDTSILEGIYVTTVMPGGSTPYFDYSLKNNKNRRADLKEFDLIENGMRK